jgi:hypothetical protein
MSCCHRRVRPGRRREKLGRRSGWLSYRHRVARRSSAGGVSRSQCVRLTTVPRLAMQRPGADVAAVV